MRIPTPVIDIILLSSPYLLGFAEKAITGESLILNSIDEISFGEKSILYILTILLVEFVDYKLTFESTVKNNNIEINKINVELAAIKNKQGSVEKKIELINFSDELDSSIKDIEHPYFINLITNRLKQLLSKNKDIFKQTELTSPTHVNTFGAKGIKMTETSLKCVSFIPEYWEDKKDTEYMDLQRDLITRGVKIQRLFIVNDENRESTFAQMKVQNSMNIETKYIEQSMVDSSFRERDFLIQDNRILIDLFIDEESEDKKHSSSKELVTTDDAMVLERKEEFSTNWATAKTI